MGRNEIERLLRRLVLEGYLQEDLVVNREDIAIAYVRPGKKCDAFLNNSNASVSFVMCINCILSLFICLFFIIIFVHLCFIGHCIFFYLLIDFSFCLHLCFTEQYCIYFYLFIYFYIFKFVLVWHFTSTNHNVIYHIKVFSTTQTVGANNRLYGG